MISFNVSAKIRVFIIHAERMYDFIFADGIWSITFGRSEQHGISTVALKVAPRERSLATILSPIAPRERSLTTVMSPIAPRERSHATVLSPVARLANVPS